MKRLIGRTDVEDALKKLDKLMDEEARMVMDSGSSGAPAEGVVQQRMMYRSRL
jgi:hypothetical protein